MKRLLYSLAALGALAAALVYALGAPRLRIARPRLGIPAIRLAGSSFRLEVVDAHPWGREPVTARIEGFAGEFELTLSERPIQHGAQNAGDATRWFKAELPAEVPAGSYELLVRSGELEARRERAVWVEEAFSEDLLVAQLADLPTFGYDEAGDRAFEQIVRELNLIDPDVVLITGDVAYGGSVDQYARLYSYLLELEMPVIAALGNHEYEGLASYFETFGAPYHEVGFGGFSVFSLNSAHGRDQLTTSQRSFLHERAPAIVPHATLIQLHHPVFGERRVMAGISELREFVERRDVPIVLSGHLHRDMVFDAEGTARFETHELPAPVYVVTTAAGAELRPLRADRPSFHGYRLIWLSGRELVRYSYDFDGDGVPDGLNSIPAGLLEIERPSPTEARVTNGWNESVADALLRFELDGDRRALEPSSGVVVERAFDGASTRIAVELDVPAGETSVVRLGERP